jgi:dUTP pyrophosphatase
MGFTLYFYKPTLMIIKIHNKSTNPLPQYQTEGSAGMDLSAFLHEVVILQPMQRALIPTGIHLEIPMGYEAQLRPRSGLAIKQGITLVNSPATIDSDYRGELKIIVINLSTEEQVIKNGDRIAQLIIAKYEKIAWEEAIELSDTERGNGGFGHTGKQ